MIPGYFGTSGPQCSHQRKIIVYSWSTINACSLPSHEYWVPLIKFMVGPFMWEEGVRIYGISGVPNNFPPSTHPVSLITIHMPLLSITLFSYLNQPPKPTHIHTLAPSISLSPSPVNQPCTTTFGGFHQRTPLETPYTPFSRSFKGKTLNCLVAFQVFLKFLSNLSYMSGIHAIEYMGFWFGGFIC